MPKFSREVNVDRISASESANLNNATIKRKSPLLNSSFRNASFAADTTLTAEEVLGGYVDTTAVCTLTLPTGASLISTGALSAGDSFELIVDGLANGAATTIADGANCTNNTDTAPAVLVVPLGMIGVFRFVVGKSGAALKYSRIA